MSLIDGLASKLIRLDGKAHYFVGSIALLGTLLVGSSFVAWQSSREQQRMAAANVDTITVLRSANAVKLATLDVLRSERGYLLTGDGAYLDPYRNGREALAKNLDELDRATRGQAKDEDAVAHLRAAVSGYLTRLASNVALARNGDRATAIAQVRRANTNDGITAIEKHADGIIEDERVRLRELTLHASRVTTTLLRFVYLMSFAGICLLALSVLSAMVLRRSFARERIYRDELQVRAETDELTGVANRRRLLTVLDRRIAEARLDGTALSFAMFDLDNFKRVNDTHGHAVGDRAIRHVVRTALRMVRVNDLIGRLGGEEFGIILPKADSDNAFIVCERLRLRLREENMPLDEEQRLHLTISSGIACLTDEDDAASLIERADKALYAAKRDGRDQVRLAA
jgi:diguanylate cyclase (GGDEF)-like protein